MNHNEKIIRDNYLRVCERAKQAADDAGRTSGDVRIIAVTKYVDNESTQLLVDAGCRDIGESRPQVLESKATVVTNPDVTWHLIGHLQRNKVARTLKFARMIHSVDTIRLAKMINRIAGERTSDELVSGQNIEDNSDPSVGILLEVNVSGEPAKQGFQPSEISDLICEIDSMEYLSVNGLMCMAGLGSNEHQARRQFASLRELRDRLQSQLPNGNRFCELSMGMSGDFEMAIAEGATMIRVGSSLFDGLR